MHSYDSPFIRKQKCPEILNQMRKIDKEKISIREILVSNRWKTKYKWNGNYCTLSENTTIEDLIQSMTSLCHNSNQKEAIKKAKSVLLAIEKYQNIALFYFKPIEQWLFIDWNDVDDLIFWRTFFKNMKLKQL